MSKFDEKLTKINNLKLIVFDLGNPFHSMSMLFMRFFVIFFPIPDYTLWPFWVDTHVRGPFNKKSSGEVRDVHGQKVDHFPEVTDILKELHSLGYELGIASRTNSVEEATSLVEIFGWNDFFKYKEIYPGKKTTHFSKMKKDSLHSYSEMLFFDDEHRNIKDLNALGVVSILVNKGVSRKVVFDGLETFKTIRVDHRTDLNC